MQASHHDQPYVDEMHMQAAMKRGCQSPWTAADYIEDGHLIQLAWGACVLLQQKVKRALSVWNGRSHHLLEVSFIQNLSGILRFSALYKFGGIYVWDWCHQQLCGEPKKSVVSCRQFVCRRVGEIAIFAEDGLVSRVSSCSSHHEDLPYIAPIWSDNGKSDSNEDVQNLFFLYWSHQRFYWEIMDSIFSIFSRSNSANRKWSLKKSVWYKICLILLSEIKFLGHWEDIMCICYIKFLGHWEDSMCICYFMLQALQKSDPSGIYLIQTFYLSSEIKFLGH